MNRKDRMRTTLIFAMLTYMATVVFGCVCRADEPPAANIPDEPPVAVVATGRQYDGAAWQEAVDTGKPLVIFVSQPYRSVPGCVSCRKQSGDVGVLVGIPFKGEIQRVALSGEPTDGDILAAAHKLDKALHAPPVQAQAWSNVGSCNCQRTTGRCQCIPASKCPNGCPAIPTSQAIPAASTYTLPSYSVPCRT